MTTGVVLCALLVASHRSATLNPAQVANAGYVGYKRIALTFDDGPRPIYTQRLIDILRDEKIHGTFFVVGKQAERYPGLILELLSNGHEVANHSWSHPSVRTLNLRALKMELDRTRLFLKQLTGMDTPLFRAPGGTVEYLTHEMVVPQGYRMILWTVHSMDHEHLPADLIRKRVLEGARDGAVVLFHTGVKPTLEALPVVIDQLRAQGFAFVTVSELLGDHSEERLVSTKTTP